MKTFRHRRPGWAARGYFWLADRLYHELAPIYDPVSNLVSLGKWDTARKWAFDYLVGPRVLEIGFGTGELLLELAHRRIQAVGLDPSVEMHRITAMKMYSQMVSLPRVRATAQEMPFAANTFNSIVATFPAGYIFDPATWREASRLICEPNPLTMTGGGRFIVVGICISSVSKPIRPVFPFLFGLSLEEILEICRRLAQPAGLSVRIVMRKLTMLELPILIAEKKPKECHP